MDGSSVPSNSDDVIARDSQKLGRWRSATFSLSQGACRYTIPFVPRWWCSYRLQSLNKRPQQNTPHFPDKSTSTAPDVWQHFLRKSNAWSGWNLKNCNPPYEKSSKFLGKRKESAPIFWKWAVCIFFWGGGGCRAWACFYFSRFTPFGTTFGFYILMGRAGEWGSKDLQELSYFASATTLNDLRPAVEMLGASSYSCRVHVHRKM